MSRIIILLMTLSVFSQQVLHSQNFNRPVPTDDVYPYEFIQYDTNDYGYYIAAPLNMLPAGSKSLKPRMNIYDKDGYLTWYSTNNTIRYFDFKFLPDTNMFASYFWNNPHGYHFIDSTLQIIETFSIFENQYINPHEFQILSNGNVVFIVYKDSIMDLSAYTFAGIQGSVATKVTGDLLFELDSNRNIVFRWSTFDHIFPTETYDAYGYYANGFDYTHSNSIAEDNDGHLLISFRHLNAVYKINRNTGDVIWRLGGKSNDFTFVNDTGFSAQHDFRAYPDGTYSVYDNAVTTTGNCRAVIYTLDTINMTATKVWEYVPQPAFPALLMGNFQITPDNNHLINYGTNRRPHPSFEFQDSSGNKISQMFFKDSILSYRSNIYKLPFDFPRPLITCTLATGGLILSAPAGYTSYKWSTNETTKDIFIIDTTAIYQVWVDYGLGMLGSHPFFANNPLNACEPMSIDENKAVMTEETWIIYDLLGKQVRFPKHGNIYIYLYKSGKSELKYYIDYH